jgi:hypothetical protein
MKQKKIVDYAELIQSYINALTNLVSMEQAKYAAEVSEQTILQGLNSIEKNNGLYLTPDDISTDIGERVVKDSVNAHLTKVQSEQIIDAVQNEVTRLEDETKKIYIGKKVTITIQNPKSDIVDAVMLDKITNEYRISKYNAKKIKGTIENISFHDNLLVIKPTLTARFIVPNRILIHIYVINLETMTPNIKIQ